MYVCMTILYLDILFLYSHCKLKTFTIAYYSGH